METDEDAVAGSGVPDGPRLKSFCDCWGLRPGWSERQQQLQRQREHRGRGVAEILFNIPIRSQDLMGDGLYPTADHFADFLNMCLDFDILRFPYKPRILS